MKSIVIIILLCVASSIAIKSQDLGPAEFLYFEDEQISYAEIVDFQFDKKANQIKVTYKLPNFWIFIKGVTRDEIILRITYAVDENSRIYKLNKEYGFVRNREEWVFH